MLSWIRRLFAGSQAAPESDEAVPAVAAAPGLAPVAPTTPSYAFTDDRVRIAAIGDLHGRLDLLERLEPVLDAAAQDPARRLIEVYLGDYVDRGANPRGIVEHLMRRTKLTDRTVVCLAGNHEQMLLSALEKDTDFLSWLDFGGQSTLQSYGIAPARVAADPSGTRAALADAIPASHVDFLRSLPLSFAHGGFFFAHAGVRPGVALDSQTSRDLLWIRQPFLGSSANLGAIVVHGHTPTRAPVFRLNRIGIDTGAYQTGVLTCLLITSERVVPVDTMRLMTRMANPESPSLDMQP